MDTKTSRQVKVLIVDDDDIDRRSIRRAFREEKVSNPLIEAKDGQEALELLQGGEGRPPLERPYLVLLDISMPRMNGHEFLEALRRDHTLKDTIVFVLTTSDDDKDKNRAYDRHIAGYLLKKSIGAEFLAKVRLLDHFVLSVEFPGQRGPGDRDERA